MIEAKLVLEALSKIDCDAGKEMYLDSILHGVYMDGFKTAKEVAENVITKIFNDALHKENIKVSN